MHPLTDLSELPPVDERFAIVGCGKQKANEKRPAKDLYTSWYADLKTAFAEQYVAEFCITSAKHNLISPDTVIEPYNKRPSDLSVEEREAWQQNAVKKATEDYDLDSYSAIFVLAGKPYRELLLPVVEAIETPVYNLFSETSGIGDQRKLLRIATNAPSISVSLLIDPRSPAEDNHSLDEW